MTHVITLLCDTGVTTKLQKCEIFYSTISYLGHVIYPGLLLASYHTIKAIWDLKPPVSISESRSFLGLCNILRRFLTNFARIRALLSRKWRKDQRTHLEKLAEDNLLALQILKQKINTPRNIGSPEIHRNLHLGHQRLSPPGWLHPPAATARRTRQTNWILIEISKRRGTRLRHHIQGIFRSGSVRTTKEAIPGKHPIQIQI